MTRPERQRQNQAAQWLRLRELRQTQAEAQMRAVRQAQAEALAATQAAQAKVAQHQGARQALLADMAQGAWLPRWAEMAHARREVIEDLLERAEYALIDDEETLHQCDQELDQAGHELRRACTRSDAAQQTLAQARRQVLAADERRLEGEDPPSSKPPASFSGVMP